MYYSLELVRLTGESVVIGNICRVILSSENVLVSNITINGNKKGDDEVNDAVSRTRRIGVSDALLYYSALQL